MRNLKKPEKTPNILTNHVRFSSNISSTIPNAKYVSILRDPIGHFVSTFEYFHHIGVFNSLERGEKGLYQEGFRIKESRTPTDADNSFRNHKSFSKTLSDIIKMTQGGASGSLKISISSIWDIPTS